MNRFDLIAFDADDTLWHSERFYQEIAANYKRLMAPYAPPETVQQKLDQTEMSNLPIYGYGLKSFTLSLIETALDLSGGRVSGAEVRQILRMGKDALQADIQVFDHARETLAHLSARCPLMLITKGDLSHQQTKIDRSGLREYFRFIEIVHDKTRETYEDLFSRYQIAPRRFLMVGDSLRSDILPVIALGGQAVYIPSAYFWDHERAPQPETGPKPYAQLENIGQLIAWIDKTP